MPCDAVAGYSRLCISPADKPLRNLCEGIVSLGGGTILQQLPADRYHADSQIYMVCKPPLKPSQRARLRTSLQVGTQLMLHLSIANVMYTFFSPLSHKQTCLHVQACGAHGPLTYNWIFDCVSCEEVLPVARYLEEDSQSSTSLSPSSS